MSPRSIIACAALAAGLAASCGGEKGGADPSLAKGAPPPAGAALPAATPEPAPAAPGPEERLAGRAIAAQEAGGGAESALALALGADGRAGGELVLGASRCAIAGMVEESIVRAWLTCPAAGGASAKKGTLVGEASGAGYSGTFAVSDDGAAEVIRGTWTAGR